MKEVEKQLIIKIITQDLGISMHLKGGRYIEEAVALTLQDPSIFVMQMYQTIAEKYSKSVASIEHTIRYAIEITYDKNKLNYFFPHSFGRPSNSEVIWTIVENVKRGVLVHDVCAMTCSIRTSMTRI